MSKNKHHLWWPRRHYASNIEKEFRNLPCNIVEIDIEVHRLIHIHSQPPTKPQREEMLVAILNHKRMECACKRSHNDR